MDRVLLREETSLALPPWQMMDPQMFKQGLLHGDPGIIYPILTWMLQKLPELQKRAYA